MPTARKPVVSSAAIRRNSVPHALAAASRAHASTSPADFSRPTKAKAHGSQRRRHRPTSAARALPPPSAKEGSGSKNNNKSPEITETFNVPHLKVVLPPLYKESDTTKLLSMDIHNKTSRTMDTEVSTDNNVTTTTTTTTTTLNVEEFECGLSVEGSSCDKQEWAFTLYDFDGRGKVTKEELGRLLQTLYHSVGTTINLPPNGTKTLKLRLTVSPDAAKSAALKENEEAPDKIHPPLKKELNKDKDHKEKDKDRECNNVKKSKIDRSPKLNNLVSDKKLNNNESPAQSPNKTVKVELRNNLSKQRGGSGGGGGGCSTSHSPGKRLSSAEQRHLVDLVQRNMERNQSSKQHRLRRHHSEQVPRTQTIHTRAAAHLENPDRRNYYLDLAGIENPQTGGAQVLDCTAPAAVLDSPHVATGRHAQPNPCSKLRNRTRASSSRFETAAHGHRTNNSNDLSANKKVENTAETFVDGFQEAVEDEDVTGACDELSPTFKLLPKSSSTPVKAHKFRPVSLPAHIPETASPHHHRRHRHRDKNHNRAMAQVAEWIDREHSFNADIGEQVVIQKHDHHHIHEHHHHHHYHHYHET